MKFIKLTALLLVVSMGAVANAKQKARVLRDEALATFDIDQTTITEAPAVQDSITIEHTVETPATNIVEAPINAVEFPESIVLKASTPFSRIVQSLKDVVKGVNYTWTIVDLVLDLSHIQTTDKSYNLAGRIVSYIINKIEFNSRVAANAATLEHNQSIDAQNAITHALNDSIAEQNAIVEAQNAITQALNDQSIAIDSQLSMILQEITEYLATIEASFDSILPMNSIPDEVVPSEAIAQLVAIEPIVSYTEDTQAYVNAVTVRIESENMLLNSLKELQDFLSSLPVVTPAVE